MSSVMRFDEWQDSNGNAVASGVGGTFSAPGSVLQVVSTTKTDTFSTSSTSFVDVTGLSATITPTSSNSKILVLVSSAMTNESGVNDAAMQLSRGGTAIFIGDAAGSRYRTSMSIATASSGNPVSITANHLDSPNTTGATTYAVQIKANATGSAFVNRSSTDTDSGSFPRNASSITLLEIAG